MSFNDKTLTCRDCSEDFVWTSGEQEFYASKGLTKQPSRCPDCRSAGKSGNPSKRESRPMYDVICCECHAALKLPFQPKSPSSFRCKECQERYKNRPMYEVTCCDCGQELRLPFQPKNLASFRCKECKEKRESMMHDVVCSFCETPFRVPFEPDYSRPIYCRDCKRAGNKVMYPATCNNCLIDFEVPFDPDPSRPIYCQSCKDEREARRLTRQWGGVAAPNSSRRDSSTYHTRESVWTYNAGGGRYNKGGRGY